MLTSDSLDRRIHKLHVRSQLHVAKRPVSGCGHVFLSFFSGDGVSPGGPEQLPK